MRLVHNAARRGRDCGTGLDAEFVLLRGKHIWSGNVFSCSRFVSYDLRPLASPSARAKVLGSCSGSGTSTNDHHGMRVSIKLSRMIERAEVLHRHAPVAVGVRGGGGHEWLQSSPKVRRKLISASLAQLVDFRTSCRCEFSTLMR